MDFSLLIFNQSKLQNEYDINCRVLIDDGKFSGYEYHLSRDKHYTHGQELIMFPAKIFCFYGEPFYHSEVIELPLDTINPELELKILLFLVGKHRH